MYISFISINKYVFKTIYLETFSVTATAVFFLVSDH